MRTIQVKPPKLHPGQLEVAQDPARFKVLACGRRWGKTRLASALCLMTAVRGGRAWWVAPTYPIASIGWRLLKRLGKQLPGISIREVDRRVTFPGGGTVTAKSADNPDSLRGEGLDFVALDECAFMKEAAWTGALRPALTDREGKAVFISTPKGQNWFYRLWLRTKKDEYPEWKGWQHPSEMNPHLPREEIEQAKHDLPETIFQQEYMAQFIADAGTIFRRVMEAATAEPQDGPIEGHTYVIGTDWGRINDATVNVVLDATANSMAEMDRYTGVDFDIQIVRLMDLCRKYKPNVIIPEYNAMGMPLVERLQRDGLPVQPFTTTNATKAAAVEALALAFERGELQIINDPTLVSELQAFERKRVTDTGKPIYGAPEGMHDDCVVALMLAWQGAVDSGPWAWLI